MKRPKRIDFISAKRRPRGYQVTSYRYPRHHKLVRSFARAAGRHYALGYRAGEAMRGLLLASKSAADATKELGRQLATIKFRNGAHVHVPEPGAELVLKGGREWEKLPFITVPERLRGPVPDDAAEAASHIYSALDAQWWPRPAVEYKPTDRVVVGGVTYAPVPRWGDMLFTLEMQKMASTFQRAFLRHY